MRRQPFAGGGEALRCPDMVPLAIMYDRLQASRLFGTIEKSDKRENAVGNAGEGAAVKQLDAGEEKGRDLALTAAVRAPRRVDQIVAAALVTNRRRRSLQQQDCVHALGIKSGGEPL